MTSPHQKPRAVPDKQPPVQTRIRQLASEIVRIEALDDEIDSRGLDITEYHGVPIRLPPIVFQNMRRKICDRRAALEVAIRIEEPQTLDDAGTFAVLLHNEIKTLLDMHDLDSRPSQQRLDEQARIVQELGNALVRCIRRMSTSPLFETEYYWRDALYPSWPNSMAASESELEKLKTAPAALKALAGKVVPPAPGEMVHTQFPCSSSSFALDVFDARNEPDFREGVDRIVIDPSLSPRSGDMVLAVVKEDEPVFGRYVVRQGGDIAIVPINDKGWPEEVLVAGRGDRIIGVMTEKASPAQRGCHGEA